METFDEYFRVCYEAAKLGGQVLMDRLGRVQAHEKGRADLVTEADLASQRAIAELIGANYPDHAIVGEELLAERTVQNGESPRRHVWYIDPLDGTTNYVHQVPHFSVSVALAVDGKPVVGVVFNPVRNECFSAVAGQGAWLEDPTLFGPGRKRLRTSGTERLQDSLVAIGLPANVQPDSADLKMFLAAVPRCQAIRRTGSAALNLAYVAAGRFDAAWSFSTHCWDVAAGVLMISEAGGAICNTTGQAFSLPQGHVMAAASRSLLQEVCSLAAASGLM